MQNQDSWPLQGALVAPTRSKPFRGFQNPPWSSHDPDFDLLAEKLSACRTEWAGTPGPWHHIVELLPLLSRENLTAILFSNDAVAYHLAKRIASMGTLVPQELSLVSCDNALDFTRLPVSTVDNRHRTSPLRPIRENFVPLRENTLWLAFARAAVSNRAHF